MSAPQYRLNAECGGCFETRPLLMPVWFYICFADGPVAIYLCLDCRLNCGDPLDFKYSEPCFYSLARPLPDKA